MFLALAETATGKAAVVAQSSSGQFTVRSPYPTTPSLAQLIRQPESQVIALQPDPLAVAGERVKLALLRELGLRDRWQGRIRLNIRSDISQSGTPLVVVATKFSDGWAYTLDLPEEIERDALVRLLLQALLMELANRNSGPFSPELPIWLLEGMAERIQSVVGPELVPQQAPLLGKVGSQLARMPPMTKDQIGFGAAEALRNWLREHPPLSFNDLSLPPPRLQGDNLKTYRASAQLFVSALLQLPNGKRTMTDMISLLPQRLNWQTAFLEAYRAHFPRLLAVEQWWALVSLQFLAGTEPHSWSPQLTRRKLDDALQVLAERRVPQDQTPVRAPVPLQEIIRQTPYAVHRELLRTRLAQLEVLQQNAAPEFVPLINQYAKTLREYLYRPGRPAKGTSGASRTSSNIEPAAREVISKLDQLDRRRLSLPATPPGPPPKKP
ncbi:MAG: hypothetical protein QHJ82_02300 [Verrucomicrobiota bacterium]|nr:hypothetical protein [Verrucomicrobiota bacterium]